MTTFSGGVYQFGAPENRIELGDIAVALSRLNRFCGHTTRPYSVAEHSVLCSVLAGLEGQSRRVQLLALLHDAAEAYVGDVITPVKEQLGEVWERIESNVQWQILAALKVTPPAADEAAAVHRLDRVLAVTEQSVLMRGVLDLREGDLPTLLVCPHGLAPHLAERLFLERYAELTEV